MTAPAELVAPFPYYGGKAKFAADVWRRLGRPRLYAEPFCGSAAVLLAAPQVSDREIVCDTDGYIVNFWRAVRADPDGVAEAADYPTFHQDLTARHRWLVDQRDRLRLTLSRDPDAYDVKIAGWWVWGMGIWIGSGFCAAADADAVPDKRPLVRPHGGGRGVSAQRQTIPGYVPAETAPPGPTPFAVSDRIPVGDGTRLRAWLRALADRLQHVIVLDRDWTAATTNAVLGPPSSETAVFLDPPYVHRDRAEFLYASDLGPDQQVAEAAHAWAVDHGHGYRIAYACLRGDFTFPPDWECVERSLTIKRGKIDQVWFSPACADGDLLGRAQAEYAAAAARGSAN